MKILHLLGAGSYLPWTIGGSIVYCHRLCQELKLLGVESRVAIHQSTHKKQSLGEYVFENVPVLVLPHLADENERQALFSRTTKDPVGFKKLLEEFRPDVVHFHDFTVVAGIAHMRLAKQGGCKIVMTYHTPGNSCSQHGLHYRSEWKRICDGEILLDRCSECRLSGAGFSKILGKLVVQKSLPFFDPKGRGLLSRLFTTRRMTELFRDSWLEMSELVDGLHVYAQWVKDIIERNRVSSRKVYFFRSGGPTLVPARSQKSSDGTFRMVFSGRATFVKGLHVLVDAIRSLPRDLPIEAHLFIAEREWEQKRYGDVLKRKIEGDSRFKVKFGCPQSDLFNALGQYDAAVVPSLWLETGPLTVFEAFAAGLPVIGSRLGGISELVEDGVNGLLFEPGDSRGLADLIKRLVRERDLLSRLTSHVKPPRTMSDVAKDSVALYRGLMS